MERPAALVKLRRLLGKSMGYQVDPRAPKPEEREAAKALLPDAVRERNALRESREARRAAILAADEEYQRLSVAATEAARRVDHLSGAARHFKITVGTTNGLFFSVKAEGDSWEQVIAKLEAKNEEVKK